MLYDISTQSQLRAWLIRTLEPICDADPLILADYVIALLSHDGPEYELRKMFISQLEEFLDQKSAEFVDTLFSALRSKAYLPYNSPGSSTAPDIRHSGDSGIPIPLDALLASPSSPSRERSLKRTFESRDDVDFASRPPPKGPRVHNQAHQARSPRGDWGRGQRGIHRNNGSITHDDDMNGVPTGPRHGGQSNGVPMNGPDPQSQRDRPICRDYHNKGYCARGALCNYSHGEDAIVPPAPVWMPPNGSNFNPMMGPMGMMPMMMPFGISNLDPNGVSSTYDPNESGMNMNPMMNLPLPPLANTGPPNPDMMAIDGAPGPLRDPPFFMNPNVSFDHGQPTNGVRGIGGSDSSRHGSDMRGGRGGRRPPASGRGGPSRDDKTLVIEKIPPENLGLGAINDWFKRFGTITNVAVDTKGAKALLTFSSHDEAAQAWKSQDAVFGNRFVKVYWHRPMDGQGAAGKRALEASAPLVQNALPAEPTEPPALDAKPPLLPTSKQSTKISPDAKAKAEALEKNIAEQKVLFSRLKSAQGQEKKDILAQIRVLSEAMDNPVAPTATTTMTATQPDSQVNGSSSKLAQLDKELDLQQAVQDLTRRAQDPSEDQETIRKELEQLTQKAAAEGVHMGDENDMSVDEQAPSYHPSTRPYRPYRGRGRGRPFYRGGYGRGAGGGRSSLKLDNRPKTLVLAGVPSSDDQLLEHVREWHQATGQADTLVVGENGDVTAQFRTRAAAEQAHSAASLLKEHIPSVQVSWPTVSHAVTQTPSDQRKVKTEPEPEPYVTVAEERDEELGWGQGDDD